MISIRHKADREDEPKDAAELGDRKYFVDNPTLTVASSSF
jgi:hypothetical protein